MGRNRDVYIAHGEAADSYCGRVLVGLLINHESFAVSYADFIPINAEESLAGGISQDNFQDRQQQLDTKVNECLDDIFGTENLARSPYLRPFASSRSQWFDDVRSRSRIDR